MTDNSQIRTNKDDYSPHISCQEDAICISEFVLISLKSNISMDGCLDSAGEAGG